MTPGHAVTVAVTEVTLVSLFCQRSATGRYRPRVAIMRSINSGPSRRDKDKDKGDGEGGGMRSSHDAQVLRERAERRCRVWPDRSTRWDGRGSRPRSGP